MFICSVAFDYGCLVSLACVVALRWFIACGVFTCFGCVWFGCFSLGGVAVPGCCCFDLDCGLLLFSLCLFVLVYCFLFGLVNSVVIFHVFFVCCFVC